MDNFKIYQFENNLKQYIINSELPPGILYFILKQTTDEIYNLYVQSAEREYQQQQQITKDINDGLSEKVSETVAEGIVEEFNKALKEQSGQE